MQAGLNNGELTANLGFASDGQFYFYQRWHELFSYETTDSYQYRVANTHSSLREVVAVIHSIRSEGVSVKSLYAVLKECHDLVSRDTTMANNILQLQTQLKQHLKEGCDKFKNPNMKTDYDPALLRLHYHSSYVIRLLDEKYLSWLLIDLKQHVTNSDLDKLEATISSLATQLVNRGWSASTLYKVAKEHFKDSKRPFGDRWVDFEQYLARPVRDYQCFLRGDTISNDRARLAGLEIKRGQDLRTESGNPLLGIDDRFRYVCMTVSAFEAETAGIEALRKLNQSLDIYTFFEAMSAQKVASATVYDEETDSASSVTFDSIARPWETQIEHPGNIAEGAFKMLSSEQCDLSSKEQIHGSLLYARLSAMAAPFEETGFMNLWIALESFVQSGKHSSIIGHVKTAVPAAMCASYFYRMLSMFARDCERCGIRVKTATGTLDYKLEPRLRVVEEILAVLRDNIGTAGRTALAVDLEANCSVNTLLKYRCQTLRTLLRSGETASTALTNHYEKVSQHVQRLYRMRNAMTHSAQGNGGSLRPLIRTLKGYLGTTMAEVVYRFQRDEFRCIEEVISAVEDNYLATTAALKTTPYSAQVLLSGALFN